MEAELSVVCDCGTENAQKLFSRFLHDETRPVLEEDVVEEERSVFNVLDECPPLEWFSFRGDRLLDCHWFIGGGDYFSETQQILRDLSRAGAVKVIGALWLDGEFNGLVTLDGVKELATVSGYDQAELKKCLGNESRDNNVYTFMSRLL